MDPMGLDLHLKNRGLTFEFFSYQHMENPLFWGASFHLNSPKCFFLPMKLQRKVQKYFKTPYVTGILATPPKATPPPEIRRY